MLFRSPKQTGDRAIYGVESLRWALDLRRLIEACNERYTRTLGLKYFGDLEDNDPAVQVSYESVRSSSSTVCAPWKGVISQWGIDPPGNCRSSR